MTKKIDFLWVVLRPTLKSEFMDICFSVTIPEGLYRQFQGGLKPEEIEGFYVSSAPATQRARELLEARDG